MTRERVTPEDLWHIQVIDHVRLSPDGTRLAYERSWADRKAVSYHSNVAWRSVSGEGRVCVTPGTRDSGPEWSPSGLHISFLRKIGEETQVFQVEADGCGEAEQLTSVRGGISSFAWSPSGAHLAFTSVVSIDDGSVVLPPRGTIETVQPDSAPVVRVARHLNFNVNGAGFSEGRSTQLFVMELSTRHVQQLTSGTASFSGFCWAPDGRQLAVARNADPDNDLTRAIDLYVIALDGVQRKVTGGLPLHHPNWSPRGDLIAFMSPAFTDRIGQHDRLWVVPAEGGEARCVTSRFDQNIGDPSDLGQSARVMWTRDGMGLQFISTGPGWSALYRMSLEGLPEVVVQGLRRVQDFHAVESLFAFVASSPTSLYELRTWDGQTERLIENPNPWLADRFVASPERIEFESGDGLSIEGWLLKPDGFDGSRKYPLVLSIHGGPASQYGWTFTHEFQVLVGMGCVVLYSNPRGSDGYGEAFKRKIVGDWGGMDYDDLMRGVDHVIAMGFVDAERLGVGGGSYGGFMVNWIVSHTNRFAAATSSRSLSNLVSNYTTWDHSSTQFGPPPWEESERPWQRSPLRYAGNISTPLLLLHGEQDYRVPISQSDELYGALRMRRQVVEFVRFPGENHDLPRSGRPDRRLEHLRRTCDWLKRYLRLEAE